MQLRRCICDIESKLYSSPLGSSVIFVHQTHISISLLGKWRFRMKAWKPIRRKWNQLLLYTLSQSVNHQLIEVWHILLPFDFFFLVKLVSSSSAEHSQLKCNMFIYLTPLNGETCLFWLSFCCIPSVQHRNTCHKSKRNAWREREREKETKQK